MRQATGSKCVLTGTSRVGYGSSKQIPQACLKAKSPRAPEQLAPPCHHSSCTSHTVISAGSLFTMRVIPVNPAITKDGYRGPCLT